MHTEEKFSSQKFVSSDKSVPSPLTTRLLQRWPLGSCFWVFPEQSHHRGACVCISFNAPQKMGVCPTLFCNALCWTIHPGDCSKSESVEFVLLGIPYIYPSLPWRPQLCPLTPAYSLPMGPALHPPCTDRWTPSCCCSKRCVPVHSGTRATDKGVHVLTLAAPTLEAIGNACVCLRRQHPTCSATS